LPSPASRLEGCYAGSRQGPLFIALGDAVDRFSMPQQHFEELVNGVEMDFTINRYETWDDLRQYCYRVASMVGHICVSIFGAKPTPVPRSSPPAWGSASRS